MNDTDRWISFTREELKTLATALKMFNTFQQGRVPPYDKIMLHLSTEINEALFNGN